MQLIHILDTHTANRIAAGEVVERPASVVKELVENSIDAGSTSITIEANGGGIDLIRVRDDGAGIAAEDASVAFARHATSKIKRADDLECIETLGFRGEALASIAAVSHLSMRSKRRDADMGCSIKINGGEMREVMPAGCPDGTLMQVENLFYNTPARLNFLKSVRTEAAAISDLVSRMMMAYPNIAFKLIQNDRVVYQSSGDGNLINTIGAIYGMDLIEHLRPISFDDGYIALSGYAGSPQIARNNRLSQSFYVNRRYIKSQKLSFSIQRAYDTRLMSGKYPFCVMLVSISNREIDVNVHPNKLDVRFKQEERVTRAAYNSVKQALGFGEIPSFLKQDVVSEGKEIWSIVDDKKKKDDGIQYVAEASEKLNSQSASFSSKLREAAESPIPADIPSFKIPQKETAFNKCIETPPEDTLLKSQPLNDAPASALTGLSDEPYRVVGQLFSCYLIIQQGDSAFFIDQHAAHERKLYEQMMHKELKAQSQMLLMPRIETLSAAEYTLLQDNIELFSDIGFEIEPFGATSISVRAVPYLFGEPQAASFLHEAIDMLDKRNRVNTKELKRALIIQQACKHAIKAGTELDEVQIRALLDDFRKEGIPLTCPHGRPIMVQIRKNEFERLFKRLV